MKAAGLREQTDEELRQLGRQLRGEMVELKVKAGIGEAPAGKPVRARTLRRDIARIETVMKERGIS